jgi:outer membrane protein
MQRARVYLLFVAVLGNGMLYAAESDGAGTAATGNDLEDFFTAALDYNPELNIARERWNIFSARKSQATGQLLPQISANANVSDNTRTATGTPEMGFTGERYSLQMSQVLFNWQAFAARSQASLLEDQSEAEYYVQLAQLLTDVADRYLAVLQAEDTLESIDSELEAMTNQVDQIQRLFDLQLARVTDLYDAQARLAAIQSERVGRNSELALRREGLRAISGVEPGPSLARLPDEIAVPPLDGSMEDWLERSRNNNRSIEARAFAVRAAEKGISGRRGAYMPRVSLVVQHQQSNVGFDNIPQSRADNNYIGIDVTMPLFAGGATRAGVREARSQRNIAESELRQTQLDIIENTRTAYLQVQAAEARIDAGRVLAESTDTSYTAMQRGFELGTVTSVDVLNALRDRFRAERDLQVARYDHIRAGLALRRDAGVLTAEDIRNVSSLLNAR